MCEVCAPWVNLGIDKPAGCPMASADVEFPCEGRALEVAALCGCVGDSGEHLSVGFENDDEADAVEVFARSRSSRVVRVGSVAGFRG